MGNAVPVSDIANFINALVQAGHAWVDSVATILFLDPGESGSATIPLPAGLVTLAIDLHEAGNRCVKYKYYVDATTGDENLALAEHYVFNQTLFYGRKYEKFHYAYAVYENTDLDNSAFFQAVVNVTRCNAERWLTEFKPKLQEMARKVVEREA